MTEAEWLASSHASRMLQALHGRLTERKLRLAACACFRAVWEWMTLPENRTTVEVAERMADELATAEEVRRAQELADFARDMATGYDQTIPARYQERTAWFLSLSVYPLLLRDDWAGGPDFLHHFHREVAEAVDGLDELLVAGPPVDGRVFGAAIRDIVPNPFRPIVFDPRWRTADAVGLATAIYEDRTFDRLPLLADALMDAGCDDEQVLSHCRSEGPHVRGCWVVDLVLGKE